jgi:hypothetical protein
MRMSGPSSTAQALPDEGIAPPLTVRPNGSTPSLWAGRT